MGHNIKIIRHISQLVTMEDAHKKNGRKLVPSDLTIIEKAALVFNESIILWKGADKDLPSEYQSLPYLEGKHTVITPEIVDSHTHLVFAGNRAKEYTMRLNGADYQDIAKAGGGILATAKATNQCSKDQLFKIAIERVNQIHSYGVGTIEVKSGYGLNFQKEYELSHIINDLKKYFSPNVQIKNTFMAAHAIPPEFKSSGEFLSHTVIPLLEKLALEKIIDAVDIFHESQYFTQEDTIKLFKVAQKHNLPVKSHADEFQDNNGAITAINYQAISTDHLLQTSASGINALAKSNTVAVLLPGTGFFLGKRQANARNFLDAGAKVAIASDFNPGSCHWDNLIQIASMAATHYKMNLAELWSAITLNPAHALGILNQGAIIEGLSPRFSYFNAESVDEITYSWGKNLSTTLAY